MQQNPTYSNRSALNDNFHENNYDPSEPYRRMMMPPPPADTEMPPSNQYYSNPTLPQENAFPHNNQGRDNIPHIPTYYTAHRDEFNRSPATRPYLAQPEEENSNMPRYSPHMQQSVPNNATSYARPDLITADPYASGPHDPYSAPNHIPPVVYGPYNAYSSSNHIPVTNDISQPNYLPYVLEQPPSNTVPQPYNGLYLVPLAKTPPRAVPLPPLRRPNSNMIRPHQKDADLSRLEVYHFIPKQNTPVGLGPVPIQPVQPMIPYYTYPYPSIPALAPNPVLLPQQQQYSPYSYPWYGSPSYSYPPQDYSTYDYQPYGYNYLPETSQPFLPYIQTIARGSQTEHPSTHTRGVSPMHDHAKPFNSTGYPLVHQRVMLTDRYPGSIGRADHHFRNSSYSTPMPDCRCIHCQRERAKVLNYYSD